MLKRRHLPVALLVLSLVALTGTERDSGQATLTMVGDIMLSRGVSGYLSEYGYDYPYGEVRGLFLKDDLTIGNLECPITDRGSAAHKSGKFLFKAEEGNAAALKRAGFDCLNLANNHSMDYLSGGLLDTMNHLEAAGLSHVGAAGNASSDSSRVFEINGLRIGVLAYSAFPPEGFCFFYNEEKPTVRYVSTMDLSGMEEDIAAMDCDFLIVWFHWGIEYQPYKSGRQELIAKRAVDAGADFVVGAHPHVVQESEVYKGKYIYYSLGNFIFDRQIPPGTDESVILRITVGEEGLTEVEEIPAVIRNGRPSIERETNQVVSEGGSDER